jgi:hypothetical protein
MTLARERRRHTRYLLPSMYTEIAVRPLDSDEFVWHGHAYDLSVGGMRFELDQPIEPGTPVAVRIQLPGSTMLRPHERKPIYAFANTVWIEEDDIESAGPVRMACVFTRFCMPGDEERLSKRLSNGRFSLAA